MSETKTQENGGAGQTLAPVSLLDRDTVRAQIQAEYDRHYQSYRKGCRGCIVGVWAVRDVARKLGIKIKEAV